MIEVVGLHYHVVEFEERKTFFHSLLVTLGSEHIVDGETSSDVAQQLYIVELEQPVSVVDHKRLVLAEFDKTAHLLFKAVAVVLNCFGSENRTHIASSGRISDVSRTSAYKGYRLVACYLKSFHKAKSHKVTDME